MTRLVVEPDRQVQPAQEPSGAFPRNAPRFARRLNTRLLLLTILFVMLAEVLIFVPSIANFRMTWLEGRLNTAATVSSLLYTRRIAQFEPIVSDETLMALGVKSIAIRSAERSELQIMNDEPEPVAARFDLDAFSVFGSIRDAFDTLFNGGDRVILFSGSVGEQGRTVEVVADEAPLRLAMLVYARNVLILSLMISAITALLVFWSLGRIVINPVRRMSGTMLAFAADPENPANIIQPSQRMDEIGIAERQLATMQRQLSSTLHQQRRLADLGLAVSKINHDMRNVLSSAQLMSDRLSDADDPLVQRLAPKLLRSLDRAVTYTGSVLAYGRAQEAPPNKRAVELARLVVDVIETLGFEGGELRDGGTVIRFDHDIDPNVTVEADPDQLFRAVLNLCRNAVQAMSMSAGPGAISCLRVSSEERQDQLAVLISDTGPGLPEQARKNLFLAFRGSARTGGTGLGLAIAREIMRAHGGDAELVSTSPSGTTFALTLAKAGAARN